MGFAGFEDGEGDAEEGFGAFEEETVPDAEDGFDGEGADEEGHEPGGGGEADGGEAETAADAVAAEHAAFVVEFVPDEGEGVFDAGHEDGDVDVGAFEGDAVRAREVGRGDDVEEDKGFFFVFVEKEEEEAGDEVEGLAVADGRVVDGEGLEDAAEGFEDGCFGFFGGAAFLDRVGGAVVAASCTGLCVHHRAGIGLEAHIVGECPMEVSFDVFAVVAAQKSLIWLRLLYQFPVQSRFFG